MNLIDEDAGAGRLVECGDHHGDRGRVVAQGHLLRSLRAAEEDWVGRNERSQPPTQIPPRQRMGDILLEEGSSCARQRLMACSPITAWRRSVLASLTLALASPGAAQAGAALFTV